MSKKPLGIKVYGSIPHMPGSRLGPSDKKANPGHVKIATEKKRDKQDLILLQEKIDGSNVGVAKLENGQIIPLTRSGYEATSSPFEQHQYWAIWVWEHSDRFEDLLGPGEWCAGEWCIQAHGTRYVFEDEPFFLFDIFHEQRRITCSEISIRNNALLTPFNTPKTYILEDGLPISLDLALSWLEGKPFGEHGAIDRIEGFVWRVERKGTVDFLMKYVRPDKIDGLFLPELESNTNNTPLYNYWGDPSESIKHLKNEELYEQRIITRQETGFGSSKNNKRVVIRKHPDSIRNQSCHDTGTSMA